MPSITCQAASEFPNPGECSSSPGECNPQQTRNQAEEQAGVSGEAGFGLLEELSPCRASLGHAHRDPWRLLTCRCGPFDISACGIVGRGPPSEAGCLPWCRLPGVRTPGVTLQSAWWSSKRVCASCYPEPVSPLPLSAGFLGRSGHLQRKQPSRSGWLVWSSSKRNDF